MKLSLLNSDYILFLSLTIISLNDFFVQCDLFHIESVEQDNLNKNNNNNNKGESDVIYNDNNKDGFKGAEKEIKPVNLIYQYQGTLENKEDVISANYAPVTFSNVNDNTSPEKTGNNNGVDNTFRLNETLLNKLKNTFSTDQNVSHQQNNHKRSNNRVFSVPSSRSFSSESMPQTRSTTKIVKNWPPNDYRIEFIEDLVQKNIAIKFLENGFNDFSQMIILPKIASIYLVKKRGTLLKLHMTSLKQLDEYTLPPSKKSLSECRDSESCESVKEISLLAKMPDERMIWLCYVHHYPHENRPSLQGESGCMVPTIENLAVPLVQWENPHFNSLYPDKPASVLNAADGFTYISAFTLEYLRIFRAYMPDWNGNFNWTGALVTDKSPTFIAEPAQILLTFETTDEVYFVLREQPSSQMTKCETKPENPTNPLFNTENLKTSEQAYCLTSIARLVRVCKGDPGGLPHISANRFATFAKADLICPATNENGGYFSYTHISNAYWDNSSQLLYATFTTEKSAPTGSALCVYGMNEFKAAFSGPLIRTNAVQNNIKSSPVPNSFSNICSRFNSKNRTDEEVTIGRRLSLRFPYRYLPVKPLHSHALIAQTGVNWLHLQAYNLPALTNHYQQEEQVTTSIIWIGTKKQLTQFALYTYYDITVSARQNHPTSGQDKLPTTSITTATNTVICKLKEIHLGRQLESFIPHIPFEPLNSAVNSQLPTMKSQSHLDRNHSSGRVGRINLHSVHSSQGTNDDDNDDDGEDSEETFKVDEEIQRIEITASNFYIMTNRQLFRLPLTRCSEYKTFDECLQLKDPHCGWNWPEGKCSSGYLFDSSIQINRLSTFSPSVDHRQQSSHECPSKSYSLNKDKDNSWTPWYTCGWINSQQINDQMPITSNENDDNNNNHVNNNSINIDENTTDHISMNQLGSCQCRVCISHTNCIFGIQQVKNCTRYDENWLPWSTWSDCNLANSIQTRKRQCRPNAICSGISVEHRSCLDDAVWFKQSNTPPKAASYNKPRISFTGHTDGFTLTHLILVAICGLLTGSLLTIILFWTCRRRRRLFDEDDLITPPSKRHISIIPSHCPNHLSYEDQQTCLTNSEPLGVSKQWSLMDEKEPIWSNKSDSTMVTGVDQRYEFLPPSHMVPTVYNKSSRSVSRKSIKLRHSSSPCYDIPANIHLLCSSPLPSPTSMVSSQSTASTLLKDKFTFDPSTEQNPNYLQDDKNNLINVIPDNVTESYNENLGKLYLAGYLYAPIEPSPHDRLTAPVATTKFNYKLPQPQEYSTIMPSRIQRNTNLVIPKPIIIQPAYSSYIRDEDKNNSNIMTAATTTTMTKTINGEILTITENPVHIA